MRIGLAPLAFALALVSFGPAAAQESADPEKLSLEQNMLLRCSAAFALVAARQEQGDEAFAHYPAMDVRGKEYFVQAGARLMDELGWSEEILAARMQGAVVQLVEAADASGDRMRHLDDVMGPCLLSLDASGI
ncbi:MAG TPA: hypothetical protein VLA37_00650 [Sphingomonadaceae bacterium]|nr:hypothetical protein [Sphingomonadaceae bacterium]